MLQQPNINGASTIFVGASENYRWYKLFWKLPW